MPLCNTEKLYQKLSTTTYIVSNSTDGRPFFMIDNCELYLEVSHCTDFAQEQLKWLDDNHAGNSEVLRGELDNVAIDTLLVIPHYEKVRAEYVLKGNTHCIKKAVDVWEVTYRQYEYFLN